MEHAEDRGTDQAIRIAVRTYVRCRGVGSKESGECCPTILVALESYCLLVIAQLCVS